MTFSKPNDAPTRAEIEKRNAANDILRAMYRWSHASNTARKENARDEFIRAADYYIERAGQGWISA